VEDRLGLSFPSRALRLFGWVRVRAAAAPAAREEEEEEEEEDRTRKPPVMLTTHRTGIAASSLSQRTFGMVGPPKHPDVFTATAGVSTLELKRNLPVQHNVRLPSGIRPDLRPTTAPGPLGAGRPSSGPCRHSSSGQGPGAAVAPPTVRARDRMPTQMRSWRRPQRRRRSRHSVRPQFLPPSLPLFLPPFLPPCQRPTNGPRLASLLVRRRRTPGPFTSGHRSMRPAMRNGGVANSPREENGTNAARMCRPDAMRRENRPRGRSVRDNRPVRRRRRRRRGKQRGLLIRRCPQRDARGLRRRLGKAYMILKERGERDGPGPPVSVGGPALWFVVLVRLGRAAGRRRKSTAG
jgi:hypothetical protein